MDEQKKENPATQENTPEKEEQPVKTTWQKTKEGWYDKVPLSLKQLDIIVGVCWVLLGLTAVCIFLEAKGIIRLFG